MTRRFEKPVLLIGGGPVGRQCFLEAQAFTDKAIAADGGAEIAARFEVVPSAIIGDMDSISPETLAKFPDPYIKDLDQSTTDFEKCLHYINAPMIFGVGFLGGRLDHELAAMNALAKFASKTVILIGQSDVVFCCPKRLELALPIGARISVFPMGGVTGLRSDGLKYALDGLEMAPDRQIGTSNEVSEPSQIIEVSSGPLLVIISRRFLADAVAALKRFKS